MSAPSSSTRPVIQPCSDSSCIRLSVRRKVDLPQPEGPISACTRLAGKLMETPFTAVNLPYIAVSLSVSTRTRGGAPAAGAGAGMGGATVRSAGSPIEIEPPPDGQPRAQAQDEYHQDQHQRRSPGVLVPLLVGPGGVGEYGQRQRGHGLVQVVAQVLAAERGEEQRRGL